jgi:hypothetical protein
MLKILFLIISSFFFLSSCQKKSLVGELFLKAPGDGSYEIYRIANESPLQFISEQSGKFNQNVSLSPGRYLVLSDCSSETVTIYPETQKVLTIHRITFEPPMPPKAEDSFAIQCSQSEKTKSLQNLNRQFELFLIHGKRDLLVGMVPIHIDFTAMEHPYESKHITYKLAGLQVGQNNYHFDATYFVSPVDRMIAATKYQPFGTWEFLLKGRYTIEVNGTTMDVTLSEGEMRIIKPALFKVSTSESIGLAQPAKLKGSPWMIEINSGHWLTFNESYPVLPGNAIVGINGSSQFLELPVAEDQVIDLQARSVTVDSLCQPEDISCFGSHNISLYEPEEPYPFVESISDIPILFIDQAKPILIGVEGSRDITYEINTTTRDRTVKLGYLKLIPQPQHRVGHTTDLVRINTMGPPYRGHSLDINLENPTMMPLIEGTYKFEHFVAVPEGDRRNLDRTITIEPGKTFELSFPVFLTEKKWLSLKKASSSKKM